MVYGRAREELFDTRSLPCFSHQFFKSKSPHALRVRSTFAARDCIGRRPNEIYIYIHIYIYIYIGRNDISFKQMSSNYKGFHDSVSDTTIAA